MEFKLNTIEEALKDLASGKMVIVMDDEERENEGDLIASSELCTPETINFMASKAKGLICVAITEDRAKKLELEPMVYNNSSLHETRFTVSVDYAHGTTTGISAYDRAATVQALANEDTKPSDLLRPGHIFPLISMNEGVLRRAGHTEGTVDLMKLAGLSPSGVLCEIINEDGTMARYPQLVEFANKNDMKIITIKDLIAYRLKREILVKSVAEANLPIEYGNFKIYIFSNLVDNLDHIALVLGDIKDDEPTLIRVHSECLTGDVFGSLRCDCGEQLNASLKLISENGSGILLYMRQEGRGIGLINKIKSYALQEDGYDTVEANHKLGFPSDPRDYGIGAQILLKLGVNKMKLITNNPKKRVGLESYGLEVVELVPMEIEPNTHNKYYLSTKKNKMGHFLHNL